MSAVTAEKPRLTLMLASPRGFCAGVDRAIQIVERAIEKHGSPVYVRHEIVHNRHVVERLRGLGAVFVEELDEVPDDRPVVFSAHGVPKSVPAAAQARDMTYFDATCPLVSKVHFELQRHFDTGREIVLIGHAGHPEVVGAMGQLPPGAVTLIETVDDAQVYQPHDAANVAFATQTTLSVEDTAGIVEVLRARFPAIAAPRKDDICYATTNRQEAVKQMAAVCDLVLVIGSPNSSNSLRLVEVALRGGAKQAQLIDDVSMLNPAWLDGVATIGVTAGASAPEELVQDLITALDRRFDITLQNVAPVQEAVAFKLPRALAVAAA
jgi:4-hydroxy-3-methylbut-2-en-1-yl diphosphate reductase